MVWTASSSAIISPCLQAANRITVYNNGDGVPVEVHKEEGVYVPELIFGHLLTSSNYNDDEKKVKILSAIACAGSELSTAQVVKARMRLCAEDTDTCCRPQR